MEPEELKELTLTQRILVRAAALISIEENWIKYKSYASRGTDVCARYCSLGALHKATHIEIGSDVAAKPMPALPSYAAEAYCESRGIIDRAIRRRTGYSPAINDFNDDPRVTHADVKAVFCDAVKTEVGNE